jgi:sugar lactone lactonase YvrE
MGAYQQGEFATQQQQLASQQKLLEVLESGLPFTNGQSAALVIGQKNFTTNLQTTSQDGLSGPAQVVFDSSGNMWVSEFANHRVLEFKPPFSNGMKASLVIGQGTFTSSETAISRNRFWIAGPTGEAFDPAGNLWVADCGGNRILEFKPPFLSGMNASVVIGQKDFYSSTETNSAQTRAYPDRFSSPTQPAFDSSGNLWVFDNDNNRVLEFKPPFGNGMNASLVLGQANFQGLVGKDSASATRGGGFSCLSGNALAIDPSDDIWVGESPINRVVEFKPPFANGMNASYEISQQNLITNTKSSGLVNLGWNIGFDQAGNLWVTSNNRFLVFKPPFIQGTRVFPSIEIGQPNFTSSVWRGGPNGLSNPNSPGFDSAGNLWVPDSGNNRVLEFIAVHSIQSPSAPGLALLNLRPLLFFTIGAVAIAASATGGVMLLRRRGRRGSPTS